MSTFWTIMMIVLVVCLLNGNKRRRYRGTPAPDRRDEEISRLTERVRALERIITDSDWRLRRDIDGL
ncbi:MAG: hypothetical protein RLO80_10640 [Hyphomonas sp.]